MTSPGARSAEPPDAGLERLAAAGPPDAGLARLAAAVPGAVVRIADGAIAWANEQLAELAGRPGSLVGTKLADLLADTGDGLPGDGAADALECGVRRPSGELRAALCHRVAGERNLYVLEDVSRLRRLEEELLNASLELSRLHRELEALRERLRGERAEREELLGVVSHELRTPVTVIGGYHRLLLRGEVGPLTEEQQRFLEESNRSCRRLDSFLTNLLEASRVGPGDEVLEVGRAAIAPLLEGVAEMFRPLLGERGQSLRIDVAPDAAEARFDPPRIERVLTNLVGNASRYAPAGGAIEIRARAVATPGADWVRRWVELEVSDDGPGVAPADRERVFEPYVQLGGGGGVGLGLGLAICRRLVEAHGGRIRLDEGPRGGARFRFTLPAEAPRTDAPEADA